MIGLGGDEEEVMELLWQNGQVVMKSQRSHRKPSPSSDHGHPLDLIPAAAVRGGSPPPYYHHHDPSLQQQQNDADNHHLFIQEDEMSTWLLSDFCSDLLLPAATSAVPSRPARPPPAVPPPKRFDGFGHFSRLNRPRAATAVEEATVVDSSDTPMVARASDDAARRDVERVGAQSTSVGVRDAATRDLTVTSSSGASSASSEPIPPAKSQEFCPPKMMANVPDERKRKARDGEDVEPVPNDAKRVLQGSSSTKKSRSSEVHNLSERRRRDRINEKMRALQELIPHCNKADKASLLDEAIGYLKSLQMQVQMMSMGCGMMPMMYPGVQQYMPHMGMGMNRPMIHFPNVMLPTPGARPHMGPTFHFPGFQMPLHIPAPDLSRMPPANQPDAMLSSSSHHDSNSPRMPGFMDPYHQFFGLQHMHLPFQQSQANTSSNGKPTTSKAGETSRKESPD